MDSRTIRFAMAFLLVGLLSIWLSPLARAADRVVVIPMGGGGKPLQNVVTVAKSNGQFTDPVAAMNSITDASAANPYLLYIGPGQYTLTTPLIMKPFVDVTGSGEQVTWLMGAISSATINETSAIVKGANNAALSQLSVSNTGGGQNSIGIYTTGLNVTARLQQLSVYAKGGNDINLGVVNIGSSPMMTGLNMAVEGTGTQTSIGIFNINSSAPTIIGVNVLVWGGIAAVDIYNLSSSGPVIDGANVFAWGGSTTNVGVYNTSSNDVKIRRSTISGAGTGGIGLSNNGSANTRVSQSTLIGGASGGGYTCVASDDNLGHQLTTATCAFP
ncbi:MAG: hypothetical protein ACYDBT_11945 [Desulfobulbaceae bacterium]